ncbi:MAG: nicotinate phosphoribosyltransferase, partial [Candidatus Omnitrophota bacterium]
EFYSECLQEVAEKGTYFNSPVPKKVQDLAIQLWGRVKEFESLKRDIGILSENEKKERILHIIRMKHGEEIEVMLNSAGLLKILIQLMSGREEIRQEVENVLLKKKISLAAALWEKVGQASDSSDEESRQRLWEGLVEDTPGIIEREFKASGNWQSAVILYLLVHDSGSLKALLKRLKAEKGLLLGFIRYLQDIDELRVFYEYLLLAIDSMYDELTASVDEELMTLAEDAFRLLEGIAPDAVEEALGRKRYDSAIMIHLLFPSGKSLRKLRVAAESVEDILGLLNGFDILLNYLDLGPNLAYRAGILQGTLFSKPGPAPLCFTGGIVESGILALLAQSLGLPWPVAVGAALIFAIGGISAFKNRHKIAGKLRWLVRQIEIRAGPAVTSCLQNAHRNQQGLIAPPKEPGTKTADPAQNLPTNSLIATVGDLLEAQEISESGERNHIFTYDYTIPEPPYKGDYTLACGQRQICEYLRDFKATDEDIYLLRSTGLFSEAFLGYFRRMKFEGRVWVKPEGTVVKAGEPIVRVQATKLQLAVIKTVMNNTLAFNSLIATKTSRIVRATRGRSVVEYGLRRAQGEASESASRDTFIGGATGTSNVYAGKLRGIPVSGTMAHSFVESYPTQIEAFRKYAWIFRNKRPVLLIDTYDTIQGARDAVIAADELREKGYQLFAVRIDSGDLAQLSKQVRRIFDAAGYDGKKYHKILVFVSSDLDEYKIDELMQAGAPVDGFGVGTMMITGGEQSVLEGNFSESIRLDEMGLIEVDLSELKPQTPEELFKVRDYALQQMTEKLPGFIAPPKPASGPLPARVIGPSSSQALITDFYQLTMMYAYFEDGRSEEEATFDYFYRTPPPGASYLISAGSDKVLDYLENLYFSEEDIAYLGALGFFEDEAKFFAYLRAFRFSGEAVGVPEGTIVFPREPILRVKAKLPQAQLVETFNLNAMNFQSLTATGVSRFALASGGIPFVENANPWAQGSAHKDVSRGAFIGGASATTNISAAKHLGIPLRNVSCDFLGTPEEAQSHRDGLSGYFGISIQIAGGGRKSALGGVYKMSSVDGRDVMKISEDAIKATLPGEKVSYRIINQEGRLTRVIIVKEQEEIKIGVKGGESLVTPQTLLLQDGRRVYPKEKLSDIQSRARHQLAQLDEQYTSVEGAKQFPLELSLQLKQEQETLMQELRSLPAQPLDEYKGRALEAEGIEIIEPVSLPLDKPVLVIADVHGTLLQITWKEEYALVYCRLMGIIEIEQGIEWVNENVIHSSSGEFVRLLSEVSGRPEKEARECFVRTRRDLRKVKIPPVMPGALEFIEALHNKGVPIVITSGSKHSQVVRQIKEGGFLKFVPGEMVICADDISLSTPQIKDKSQYRDLVIENLKHHFPGYTFLFFNDWVEGIKAVRDSGGITFGLPQGKGEERAFNRDALIKEGANFILDGWRNWQGLLKMLNISEEVQGSTRQKDMIEARIYADTQALLEVFEPLLNIKRTLWEQGLRRMFPEIYGYLYQRREEMNYDAAKAPLARRRNLSLVKHIIERGFGRKLLGLEKKDIKLFQDEPGISSEEFARLCGIVEFLKESNLLAYLRAAFLYHDVAKAGLPELRRQWRKIEGIDFRIPNKAAGLILRNLVYADSRQKGLFENIVLFSKH